MRGNPRLQRPLLRAQGPTPARAGQPRAAPSRPVARPAYPRACGATGAAPTVTHADYGLPPRVRGNLLPYLRPGPHRGPTPARAGQPSSAPRTGSRSRAYPRACGATTFIARLSSPNGGLPPRVRGNLPLLPPVQGALGPTPARAGQPVSLSATPDMGMAYPRACGATGRSAPGASPTHGLPPRVRGNRRGQVDLHGRAGPTPARAGQPLL